MKDFFNLINSLKKLRLFAVVIFLIALAVSCKKPTGGIGDSIQPEDDLLYAFQTDTTTLTARTVKVDSVRSDFYSNVMIGNYVDEDFGAVRTTAILQFVPSTSKPRYAESMRIDSVVLSLVYQNATYGKNVPMYFSTKEVLDVLEYDKTYYNNSKVATASANLVMPGMEMIDPRPELASASGLSYTPALRLHLSHSLGEKLLNADTTFLDSQALFKEFFRGLAVSSETIDGQVVNYIPRDAATKLTVYYADLDGPEEVLNNADFVVAGSSCKAFTKITHQYYGTAMEGLNTSNSIGGSEYCYLQSGQGTRVNVNISSTKWLNEHRGVTINKAELIIPYDKSAKYAPLNGILVFYKPDGSEYFTYAEVGANVNVSTGLYRINITSHIQNYLAGKINTDEIVLQPVYTLSQFANSWSIPRSLLHGPQFNPDIREQNMRLVVSYTY